VLVAVLAALLAVASLSASNTQKDEILDQAKATDAFNELEANSLKKHINTNDAQLLRTLSSGRTRAKASAQAAALEKAVARKYAPNEAALLPKARHFEAKRDDAEAKHKAFEFAEGALQIAIVLTSVAIVARTGSLIWFALTLGLAGVVLLIDGFTLTVRL
jgi:hypothetical protein